MRTSTRLLMSTGLGLALTTSTGVAAAAPAGTFQQIDFRTLVNTCNGETVSLVGTGYYVIKPNPDGTSTWFVVLHSEGTGNLGNEYVLNVDRQSIFAAGGGTEIEVDARELLVTQGSAPNQTVLFNFDSTTGEVSFTIDCTG